MKDKRLKRKTRVINPLTAVIQAMLALIILAPVFLALFTGGVLTEDRGREQFFVAATGILSVLIIAFALQVRPVLNDFYRVLGRGDAIFMVATLFGNLSALLGGTAFALAALQNCTPKGVCGDSSDFNGVIFGLIVGGLYLIAAFVGSIILAHVQRDCLAAVAQHTLDAGVSSDS